MDAASSSYVRSRKEMGEFTVSDCAYPGGLHQSRHSHNSWSISLILAGSLNETTSEGTRSVEHGGVVFRAANTTHKVSYVSNVRILNIELGQEFLHSLSRQVDLFERQVHVEGAMFAWNLVRLRREWERPDSLSPLAIEGLLLELSVAASRDLFGRIGAKAPIWLPELIDILRSRFSERLTVRELAAALKLHPIHMSRAFRRHQGCSVLDFLRGIRAESALRSLEGTDLSIADIAVAVGFTDQSHLTRIIRRYSGLSPAVYRRMSQPR